MRGSFDFLKLHGFFIEDNVDANSPVKLDEWLQKIKNIVNGMNNTEYKISEIDAVFTLASGLTGKNVGEGNKSLNELQDIIKVLIIGTDEGDISKPSFYNIESHSHQN